jgi:hypothetical protein
VQHLISFTIDHAAIIIICLIILTIGDGLDVIADFDPSKGDTHTNNCEDVINGKVFRHL